MQKIWELAKERLTTEEIENELFLCTDRRRNAWNVAAFEGKLDIMQKIWK